MSEPDGPGEVRDLNSGRQLGRTASLWGTFCDNAERVRRRGPCYAVAAASDVPEAVRARLEELGVPLVDDARAGARFALLAEGEPSEWEEAGGSAVIDPAPKRIDSWEASE